MTLNRTHTTCVVEDVRRGVEGIEQKPPARTEEDRDVTEEEYEKIRGEVERHIRFVQEEVWGWGRVKAPKRPHKEIE